jgi:cob(I)alamin adenosyltransferase
MEITRLTPKNPKGLVVVITGNGKGKTTTALGIAVRACGHNLRTSIIQFMKGDIYAGEWDGIKKMNCQVELISTGKGFCGIQGNPYPRELPRMHLVLTGRDAHPQVIELADTASEIKEIKHAYRKGIEPQPGIDS